MSEDMDPRLFTECLREVSSVSALWLLVQRFAKAQDFRTVTYHSIDVQSLGDSSFGAVAIGIPAEFHRMYTEEHLYLDDPFPPFAASQITPFFWRDLPQLTTLTEKQKAYLNRAREFGFADGLVCQVFGPQARNALVSIGFHPDRPRPTDAEVLDLHVASQFAHMRFCALVAGPAAPNRTLVPARAGIAPLDRARQEQHLDRADHGGVATHGRYDHAASVWQTGCDRPDPRGGAGAGLWPDRPVAG